MLDVAIASVCMRWREASDVDVSPGFSVLLVTRRIVTTCFVFCRCKVDSREEMWLCKSASFLDERGSL